MNDLKSTDIKKVKYDYSAAWHLYIAGGTLAEVAAMTAIPFGDLQDKAHRHGWKEIRAKAILVARDAIKTDLARRLEQHRAKHQHFVLDTLEETQKKIEDLQIGKNYDAGEVSVGGKLAVLRQHDDIARRTLKLDEEKNNDPVAFGVASLIAMRKAFLTQSEVLPLLKDSEANTGILSSKNAYPDEIQTPNGATYEGEYTEPTRNGAITYSPPPAEPEIKHPADDSPQKPMPKEIKW